MKKFTIYFSIITLAIFAFAPVQARMINATIEWVEQVHDFGKIPYEKQTSYEFIFKNPGMIPLIIENVESSCGCTVPEYPKAPIPPGGEGKIKVVYSAEDKGYFSKEVTVHTNTQEKITKLQIKGIVE